MVYYTENMNKEVPILRERIKAALEQYGLKHFWLATELQRRVDPKISIYAVEKAIGGRISGRTYEILVSCNRHLESWRRKYRLIEERFHKDHSEVSKQNIQQCWQRKAANAQTSQDE